ncbi:cytochrome c oxidase subunit 5B, mitochondrial-like [Cimex lectularius]|uniref:Cytochrome c oxidase subunit 5B, mitochondrial n=1 Tax=Cimex lectularius TaxID=79782 RepID=A0A8I6SDC6_CIMLE|nr:cytochrome c oxidase subunit 5B, mitochondrial-like [Cimex lectularius]
MAALRTVFNVSKRNIFLSASRFNTEMPDPIDHATGIEKRELLAKMAGNENPFDLRVLKRGPGTKDCPNQVPSAYDSRILGCICEEDATTINWMWLHQGTPRRCACGHWFQLVYKAPV